MLFITDAMGCWLGNAFATLDLQDSQTVRIFPCHTKAQDLPTQSPQQAHPSLCL